jgi:lysophospholipase L1-like esterase
MATPKEPAPSGDARRGIAMGITVSVISLLLSIGVAEVALRYFAPIADPYEKAKAPRAVNQYIKSEFPPNFQIRTYAEEGLPGLAGSHVFTTNNMGFRGDFLQRPKPVDEFRVFMIGGSTTECLYLDDSESIDRVVQNALSARAADNIKVKVYNAGKSGDATDDHISMIVHRIIHLRPDLIVVFAGANDLTRSIYEYDPLHYVKESGTGLGLPTLLKFASTEFQLPRRLYYLLRPLSSRTGTEILEEISFRSDYREKAKLRKSTPVTDAKPRVDLESYRNNLRTIVGVAKSHGVSLVFMTQQSTWNGPDPAIKDWHWILHRRGVTYREDLMHEALESLNDVMRQVAASADVSTYDLARVIPKSSEFFYDDAHFNVRGAHEAGTGLASVILSKGPPGLAVKAQ